MELLWWCVSAGAACAASAATHQPPVEPPRGLGSIIFFQMSQRPRTVPVSQSSPRASSRDCAAGTLLLAAAAGKGVSVSRALSSCGVFVGRTDSPRLGMQQSRAPRGGRPPEAPAGLVGELRPRGLKASRPCGEALTASRPCALTHKSARPQGLVVRHRGSRGLKAL